MTDIDAQHIVANEILSFTSLHCMEQHQGSPMDPYLTTRQASTMMDVHDAL